ncbi:MAG: phosphonate C-P lyase system protein PhnG [Acetobacteraceae bacterium]|nr:phosphonate C-P lyase system protein PhnG [Acetobacteraceae bacterium]
MAVLARAKADEIAALLAGAGALPAYDRIRGPESGLVMVRGRSGGSGAPFNLGEMTVSRCTVRTQTGQIGHAYVAGRDHCQAELAALVDALLQHETYTATLHSCVIEPLAAAQRSQHAAIQSKAEATKVQFFAMRNMRA